MARILLLWIAPLLSNQLTYKPLIDHYDGEVNLSNHELLSLCDSIIIESTSNYLLSLSHYMKGTVLLDNETSFQVYENFESALKYYALADTVDSYLEFSILRNQGYLLENHWMIDGAIGKYQQALEPAFDYSVESGLSVKYNLAVATAYKDAEEAMNLLIDILHEAEENELNERVAKTYDEVALILIRSGEHIRAIEYLNRALEYAENVETIGMVYQDYSHLYYEAGNYDLQREWLNRSLELGDHLNRFISLMDMGENCLINGDKSKAMKYLSEAERLYNDKPLRAKYIKVFEWLAQATSDADKEAYYYKKRGDDMAIVIEMQEKLEAKLKQQAMQQFLLRMESDKKAIRTKNLLFYFGIGFLVVVIGMVLGWRLWWYRFRLNLSNKLNNLLNRWDDN